MTTAPALPSYLQEILTALWGGEVPLPLTQRLWDRDPDTLLHGLRVALLTGMVTEVLGMDRVLRNQVALGAFLHDVGKLKVGLDLLRKPAEFTRNEYEIMQRHSAWGHGLLTGAGRAPIASVALAHHERWDGNGYPHHLRGNEIPVGARITSVTDAYDAMTHDRPYRKALPPEAAMGQLVDGMGTQFAPEVVEAFRWAEARVFALAG